METLKEDEAFSDPVLNQNIDENPTSHQSDTEIVEEELMKIVNALKQWMDAKEELEQVMDEYNNKVDRMQDRVRDKQQEAHELYKEFSAYKWQVAREARHVLSGRRLSSTLLDEYKSKDEEADMDIERLRIEGRQLASQLKKTQEAILKKDQLSGDLFAVDFEQLKIESEALNEKLEL